MRRSAVAWAVAFALVSFLMVRAVVQAETNAGFAIILRNGTVLDGTGAPSYKAELGITGGVITKIGDLRAERAAVDVAGLFVAPGFINLHSHSVLDVLPRAENLLTQGVTTVILHSDGIGPVDLLTQMTRLGSRRLALNVGPYIGFNSVWQATAADYQVAFDVRQTAGARKAEGTFRVIDRRSKTTIESTDLGLLQTFDRWATFSGRARISSSPEERTFTVIVEQADPLVPNQATVNVSAEGFSLRGFVDPDNVEISTSAR